MKQSLRIVMAQLNLVVGDIAGNVNQMITAAIRARDEFHAHLILFPELSLTGYPPEDLLLRPDFIDQVRGELMRMRRGISGIDALIGYPCASGKELYNAASYVRDGEVIATYYKQLLPNYGVFDEKRYFSAGHAPCVVELRGIPLGITICEDAWAVGPVEQAVRAGAKLILNVNASPFHIGKHQEREQAIAQRVNATNTPLIYTNLVGGQDELVFDGGSFVMNSGGEVTQRAPLFESGLFVVEINASGPVATSLAVQPALEGGVYRALVLGVRDYVNKNGFKGAVLGLSGGIDSALTLAIAVDAIGAGAVQAVMMPSRYTAAMSREDACTEAIALGVNYSEIPIDGLFDGFLSALKNEFAAYGPNIAEENVQARVRGVLLMGISNKTGKIVLTTGNKSEMAVGYATLYGDMAGGFAVIKDVPKTLIYRLAHYRNQLSTVIPGRVLTRAPSAELAHNQKDTDSLPSYDILDAILELYIERQYSVEAIIQAGFHATIVKRVVSLIHRNEHKRRQAPPGVRITSRAFGRDWRYPIASGFDYAGSR